MSSTMTPLATRHILTDIEGTTSSLSFVKDVLFPYAAEHLAAFVDQNRHSKEVQQQLVAAAEMGGLDGNNLAGIVALLQTWIEADEKRTPLKALQGLIWEAGYESGDYQAHFYDDAYQRMKHWSACALPISVYSSGSIHAQQLFFRHSCFGDLRPMLAHHFDTTTGPKSEPGSYHTIAQALELPAQSIVFLSDVEDELDAAASVGMATVRVCRFQDYGINNAEVQSQHPVVDSFNSLKLEQA